MRLFRIILFEILFILNISKFFLIGATYNLGVAVFCVIICIPEIVAYRKKKEIKTSKKVYIGISIFAALIMFYISCFEFGFGRLGMYSLKVRYADHCHYTATHFPQEIPDGAVLTDIGLLPTIMQGDGNMHATFIANRQTLDELEKKAASEAIMSFDAKQYMNGELPKQYYDMAGKIYEQHYGRKSDNIHISVCDVTGLIRDNYPEHDIMIYIIDSNFNWNHIRTDSVVVDHTDGVIQYVGQ